MATTDTTACILCSRNCGLSVEIDDHRFTKIKGDKAHPFSQGYICQKAARLEHYQNHDDRLTSPMQRQPDGSFKAVSWDDALDDIAQRLTRIRDQHGGDAFAFAGGGGQGNHLGGAYSQQIRSFMKSRYGYNSLGQEKTGDFWLNGRLFGNQQCHTTEDVEHADYVLFIGTNPFQAHGIPNARDTLKHIKKDPERTMVVVDPRLTETAKMADIHLQLRPGGDAWLMSAMLAIIVRDNLHDREFLAQHCEGFEQVEAVLRSIPIAEYAAQADVPLATLEQVAHGYATAKRACLRIDLGIQQTLNTTLNGYLEKLLYLITGNFGVPGGNNLHTFFLPVIGDSDERNPKYKRTAHHGMFPIAGIYPPNILPDEILHPGEDRIRAVFVDSANPVMTWTNTAAYEKAFSSLELLVVVDVAMTETARLAHYVLPAASQFEKWEATGFNLEFPANGFHLRHPLFPPREGTLPEPEIYTRLLEKLGAIPTRFPTLERLAKLEPSGTAYLGFLSAFAATLASHKQWMPYAASILYRTLGKALPDNAAATIPLLPLAIIYAQKHYKAVKRAGHKGNRLTLGANLFKAILAGRSGITLSQHRFEDLWGFIAHKDGRIHLAIPEMIEELRNLTPPNTTEHYPFILMAGERRSYNANQIYRDPAWRKVDPHGAMRMHPDDANALSLSHGERARCRSEHGEIEVVIEVDDSVRTGMVTLPHGYGNRFKGSAPVGPELNRLTGSAHCDPLSRTPYHKHVPVMIEALTDTAAASA